MNMPQGHPDDIHGILLYPHAYWDSVLPPRSRCGPQPHRQELPKTFAGSLHYSGNQSPDPMSYRKAASKLFTPEHTNFTALADFAAKKYLNLDNNDSKHYEHLHGVGTWMDTAEPSLATVFKKPIDPQVLTRIAAHVGHEAHQQGVIAFSPHPEGEDKLLHMRIPLPDKRPYQTVNQRMIGDISYMIGNQLARHSRQTDEGMTPYLPAVTILPDHTGHADVLTWLEGKDKDRHTKEDVFKYVADVLRAEKLQYYPGTGILMGPQNEKMPDGSHMPDENTDEGKRMAAMIRYRRVMGEDIDLLPKSVPSSPIQMALRRALQQAYGSPPHAAKTGTIIRGINYPAGQFTPPVVTTPTAAMVKKEPQTPLAPKKSLKQFFASLKGR